MTARSLTADRIGWDFARLLRWHLRRGTRPKGKLDVPGEQWTYADFAYAISEKTVRNWLNGKNVPTVISMVERELFGENPA
jgi:hypothetical protein